MKISVNAQNWDSYENFVIDLMELWNPQNRKYESLKNEALKKSRNLDNPLIHEVLLDYSIRMVFEVCQMHAIDNDLIISFKIKRNKK